jgi:hypothetical protein
MTADDVINKSSCDLNIFFLWEVPKLKYVNLEDRVSLEKYILCSLFILSLFPCLVDNFKRIHPLYIYTQFTVIYSFKKC